MQFAMGAVTTETDFYKGGPFPRDRLWVRSETIGSNDAETLAMRNGEISPERAMQIQFALNAALHYMRTVQHVGRA